MFGSDGPSDLLKVLAGPENRQSVLQSAFLKELADELAKVGSLDRVAAALFTVKFSLIYA